MPILRVKTGDVNVRTGHWSDGGRASPASPIGCRWAPLTSGLA